MVTVSSDILTVLESLNREFSIEIQYGTYTFTPGEIEKFTIDYMLTEGQPSIGNCCSAKLSLSLIKDPDDIAFPIVFAENAMEVKYAVYVNGTRSAWQKLGTFYVDAGSVKKKELSVTLEAYDSLNKANIQIGTSFANTIKGATMSAALDAIADALGLQYTTDVELNTQITMQSSYNNSVTFTQLLQEIAIANAGNFYIDFDGKLHFTPLKKSSTVYTVNSANYDSFSEECDSEQSVTRIGNTERGSYEKTGSDGGTETVEYPDIYKGDETGFTLTFSYANNFDTQAKVDSIYSRLCPFSFIPFEIQCAGLPFLQVGDMISFTDRHGETRQLQIMTHTLECSGGFTSTFKCDAVDAKVTTIGTVDGSSTGSIKGDIKQLAIQQIRVDKLVANVVNANEVNANKITAVEADITKLKADIASVENLDAINAKIEHLEATDAEIKTLMFGSATGTELSVEFANAVASKIGDAAITSAMIESLSAEKIANGVLYTNKVQIQSKNGNIVLKDDTMQFKDANSVVRVQIGKDKSNDYSLTLWDASGNLLWDAQGVTSRGVRDGLITDQMVSEDANINGGKIDMPSLITEINGSTETIKASHVTLDNSTQTLQVAFEQQQRDIDNAESNISTLQTNLTVANGRIDSVVAKADDNASNVSALTQDINGFKTTVSSTYAKKGSIISTINQTAESITIDASKIDLSGYVTITNLATKGKTEIDGSNIKAGTLTVNDLTSISANLAGWEITDKYIQKTVKQVDSSGNSTGRYQKVVIESPTKSTDYFLWSRVLTRNTDGSYETYYNPWAIRSDGRMRFNSEGDTKHITIDNGEMTIISDAGSFGDATTKFTSGNVKFSSTNNVGGFKFSANLGVDGFNYCNYFKVAGPGYLDSWDYRVIIDGLVQVTDGLFFNSDYDSAFKYNNYGIYRDGSTINISAPYVSLVGMKYQDFGSKQVAFNGAALKGEAVQMGYSGTRWGDIYSNGKGYATNGWEQSSDLKKKDIVEYISAEWAESFLRNKNVKPITYTFKKDENHRGKRLRMGFGAQHLHEAGLELGKDLALYEAHIKSTGEEENWGYYDDTMDIDDENLEWSIDDSQFTAPIVRGLQDIYERLEKLEQKVGDA